MSEASVREMTPAEGIDWGAEEVPVFAVADVTLNVSGQLCPVPGIRIIRALDRMEPGQIIEVRSGSALVRKMGTFALRRGGGQVLGTARHRDGSFCLFGRKA